MYISFCLFTDCKIVCHPKCVPHVFNQCGNATDYIRHYGDTLRQARTTPTMRLSVADLQLYTSAWMKVPRLLCFVPFENLI